MQTERRPAEAVARSQQSRIHRPGIRETPPDAAGRGIWYYVPAFQRA
jgi:hypothetical protein